MRSTLPNRPRPCGRFFALALTLAILAGGLCGCGGPGDGDKAASLFADGPRRIVVVSLDCLRADRLGCYGCERPTSPFLDRMAAEGVRFSDVTAPATWTLPSHVSLFTGLYPAHHGVVGADRVMDPATPHLVEAIRGAGFATAAFTGGGYLQSRYGHDRGFDTYESARKLSREWERTLEKAEVWLRGHADDDAFLFLHTYEIHAPYNPPLEYVRRFLPEPRSDYRGESEILQKMKDRGMTEAEKDEIRAHYDAGIAYTDELFGAFWDRLEAAGLTENLLLIVSSDHGEEFWEHGGHGHSRDRLGTEVTGVPMIVRLPARADGDDGGATAEAAFAPGRVVDLPVSFLDVLPTALDAAGLERPEGLDGFSLLPELTGRPATEAEIAVRQRRTAVFGESREPLGFCDGETLVAVRAGAWAALLPRPGGAGGDAGAEAGSISPATERGPGLYDLRTDPGEIHHLDLAGPAAESLEAALAGLISPERAPDAAMADEPVDEATKRQLKALGY